MSRSRKKIPISGIASNGRAGAKAKRAFKRTRAGAERSKLRDAVSFFSGSATEVDADVPPACAAGDCDCDGLPDYLAPDAGPAFELEPWDEWASPRDGKQYRKNPTPKELRK